MKKPIVFVTGAGGLLGRALSFELVKQGFNVRGFGLGEQYYVYEQGFKTLVESGSFSYEMGSILDKMAVVRASQGCDYVVHLAAMKGARTVEDPLRCFDINVNGTYNVLEACVASNIKHMVLASSSAVYGEPDQNPVKETDSVKPMNSYGVTKLAAEEATRSFAKAFPGLSFTIARMFNVYGELNNSPFVIDRFVSQVLENVGPTVIGDGSQKRCFTHADDVAKGLAAIIKLPKTKNNTYNLGAPMGITSIRDLAQRVIDVLAPKSDLEIEFKDADISGREKEISVSYADITKAQNDFGYNPTIGIDEGLLRLAKAARADNSGQTRPVPPPANS